jgi:hypothetical protein
MMEMLLVQKKESVQFALFALDLSLSMVTILTTQAEDTGPIAVSRLCSTISLNLPQTIPTRDNFMKDYLNIGSSPVCEKCAQVGSADYDRKSRIECAVFVNQLKRLFPNGNFGVKSFPHDGAEVGEIIYYKEVVAYFDTELAETDEKAKEVMDAAYEAEAKTPEYWDEIACQELATREKVILADKKKVEKNFKAWLKEVDNEVSALCGLSYLDLPDWMYHDSFDAGDSPKEAAKQAFAAANEM